MKGAASMVARRSRGSAMTRVPMMPGTAQAKLDSIGMKDCPESPHKRPTDMGELDKRTQSSARESSF
jgi:hypothetical protein